MPFKSQAQAGFFHANAKALEKEGVNVSEWDKSTDFSALPKKVPSKKKPSLIRKKE